MKRFMEHVLSLATAILILIAVYWLLWFACELWIEYILMPTRINP